MHLKDLESNLTFEPQYVADSDLTLFGGGTGGKKHLTEHSVDAY